jgi:hypothetical protein
MSSRSRKIMFLGSKVWPVCTADNLTAIYEPISRQCWIRNISQPCWPVMGTIVLFFFTFVSHRDFSASQEQLTLSSASAHSSWLSLWPWSWIRHQNAGLSPNYTVLHCRNRTAARTSNLTWRMCVRSLLLWAEEIGGWGGQVEGSDKSINHLIMREGV